MSKARIAIALAGAVALLIPATVALTAVTVNAPATPTAEDYGCQHASGRTFYNLTLTNPYPWCSPGDQRVGIPVQYPVPSPKPSSTSATPTPTPTTPSPTGTPTPTPTATSIPPGTWTGSASGSGTVGAPSFNDTNFSPNSNGYNTNLENQDVGMNSPNSTTLQWNSPENWQATTTLTPPGYTGVQSYLQVQQLMNDYGPTGGTDYPTATSTALGVTYNITDPGEAGPNGAIYEFAPDIWTDGYPD